ncbi:MAG: hypothetical protein WC315_00415 [Candidatus Omnitrophota bacterium]|jgi:hypothetical protein
MTDSSLLRWYVYLWLVDVDEHPEYCGKGCGDRDVSHLKLDMSCPFWHKRLQYILDHNIPNRVIRIETSLTNDEAFAIEAKTISKYGRIIDGSGVLYNIHPGGRIRCHTRYGSKEFF